MLLFTAGVNAVIVAFSESQAVGGKNPASTTLSYYKSKDLFIAFLNLLKKKAPPPRKTCPHRFSPLQLLRTVSFATFTVTEVFN